MELHYIIVIILVCAIVIAQLSVFINTLKKISAYKKIFPETESAYRIIQEKLSEDNNDNSITVSQIEIETKNPILNKVRNALNMYLKKNKGAASDFYLMKDVVERYCDTEEEEINIQQPIPLYLGLMGTMIGIIVGISFIASSGGLSNGSLMINIISLMTCVAIAMAASLVGIFCTTFISWQSKNATSQVESEKNRFYSWLQTELLPMLSGNTTNALHLLQQNLVLFNQTFQNNIGGLNSALSKVTDSSEQQIELISLIKDIDIKRVAQANIIVLKELKDCTDEIEKFNIYLNNVAGYIEAVNNLNGNINEHLNRTKAIEEMGVFFKQEIEQVAKREKYINEVVANIDNTLRKTFDQLLENTKKGVTELQNNSINEFNSLLNYYKEQKEEFSKKLNEQKEELLTRSKEFTDLIKEIQNLSGTKVAMEELVKSTKEQSCILQKLTDEFKKHNNYPIEIPSMKFPKKIISMFIAITVMVFITFGVYIYNSFFVKTRQDSNYSQNESSLIDAKKSNGVGINVVDTIVIAKQRLVN